MGSIDAGSSPAARRTISAARRKGQVSRRFQDFEDDDTSRLFLDRSLEIYAVAHFEPDDVSASYAFPYSPWAELCANPPGRLWPGIVRDVLVAAVLAVCPWRHGACAYDGYVERYCAGAVDLERW